MVRPSFSMSAAAEVAKRVFDIAVDEIKPLDSYDDQNCLIKSKTKQYVLKISNTDFATDGLDMQNTALQALHEVGMPVPCPVACRGGNSAFISFATDKGVQFDVRLVTFLPGKLMGHAKSSYSPELLRSLGRTVGKVRYFSNMRHGFTCRSFACARLLFYVSHTRVG